MIEFLFVFNYVFLQPSVVKYSSFNVIMFFKITTFASN